MLISILIWIATWLLVGIITQLLIRIVQGTEIIGGGEYYFWSAMAGPIVLIVWLLSPLIEKWTNDIKRPGP